MKPKILIQAFVLILFTFSIALGEPLNPPKTEISTEFPAAVTSPDDDPVAKKTPPDEAEESADPDDPAAKKPASVPPSEKMSKSDDPKAEEAPEKDSAPEEPEPKDPPSEDLPGEKPKSAIDIQTEDLLRFVEDEVQNTKLDQEKKSQLRSMVMAAYRDNLLKPLWSEAEVQKEEVVIPKSKETTDSEGLPKADLPEPIDPADVEKSAQLESLLSDHGFEETELSFHPRPRIKNPECPVPLHDLTLTLGLAEVCLRLKQGPESVSEWPNWTFGDQPEAVSTKAHYKELAERFGESAAEASHPLQVAESFVPKNWVYHRILREIQRKEEAPEPPQIEIEGLVKVGNDFPEANDLADFLLREGHLPEEEIDTIYGVFSQPLSDALRAYQEVKGLQSDGILGPSTVSKISDSNEDEREQLLINLHRARRLPDVMGDKYLFANLPSGELYGFENGEETIRMRIVFGKHRAGMHTPLFRDKMETVVFRPYWNVPYSISVNEGNYSNPDYLSRNGFKIISSSGASLPITEGSLIRVGQRKAFIRQNGGTSNALGLVKFLFPNPHSVYFHDTPAKHYFKNSYRAQSHGCVRLQNPEDMANWVLKDSEDLDADKISYAIHKGGRNPVDLEKHIPVYIAYFSAFPDPKKEQGLGFHRDIYNYDRPNAVVDAPGPKPRPRTDLTSDDDKKRGGFNFWKSKNNTKRSGGSLFERLRGSQR